MSQLRYLMEEISYGLEIYFSGRYGGQYLKTAFILCDNYTELLAKLFLLTTNSNWSDLAANGRFKSYPVVMDEVIASNLSMEQIANRLKARRERRNKFFHTSSLLELNIHKRDCLEALVDMIDFGEGLFGKAWQEERQGRLSFQTIETFLRLDYRSCSDQTVWSAVDRILQNWPRRESHKPTVPTKGWQVCHHPEDLHLRICAQTGGAELLSKLNVLLNREIS